jgi:magnesium-transporting ATPase (P-type)
MAGYIAEWISHRKTIQPIDNEDIFTLHQEDNCTTHTHKEHKYIFGKLSLIRVLSIVLVGLFILGILTGFLGHNHSIADNFSVHNHQHWAHKHALFSGESLVFLSIAFFTFILLLTVSNHFFEEHIWNHVIRKHFLKIFIWVFAIMLLIKVAGFFIDIDTFSYTEYGNLILLLFALLIALLPESGPNLIILFLFIDGIVPFSMLIANSIVQEGHGGLPLIAEKPKDFFVLKLIKFTIALLIGLTGLYFGF